MRLKALASDTGAVVRDRKIGIVGLFWTLVLGFATGKERTLAGLRWAAVFAAVAQEILALVVRSAEHASALAPFVQAMLMKEAVDPNRRRLRLLARVEQRASLRSPTE